MDKAVRLGRWAAPSLLWMALWLVVVCFSLPAAFAAQGTPAKAPQYAGSDQCEDCHNVYSVQMRKTTMSVLFSGKYVMAEKGGQGGCEGPCHGPGGEHKATERIKKGEEDKMTAEEKARAATMTSEEKDKAALEARMQFAPKNLSPKQLSERCLVCHLKDEKTNLFKRSRHHGAGVSCLDCHDPHLVAGNIGEDVARPVAVLPSSFGLPKRSMEREWLDNRLLRDRRTGLGQPQLCYSCHQNIEAEFQLPVRHRVNEGLVKCTDCHNTHGSLTAREVKAVGTDACYTCHVEKRGPFVYEHASVRVEGCNGCHTPHGSINLHLLKRRQERQLCLECHVAPQATNVPHPRLGFQTTGECTRCHVEIHGSNYQMQFLR